MFLLLVSLLLPTGSTPPSGTDDSLAFGSECRIEPDRGGSQQRGMRFCDRALLLATLWLSLNDVTKIYDLSRLGLNLPVQQTLKTVAALPVAVVAALSFSFLPPAAFTSNDPTSQCHQKAARTVNQREKFRYFY